MRRSARALALAVAFLLSVLPAPVAPAAAQQITGTIALVSQNTFRTPEQPFTVTLQVRTAAPTAAVEVAVSAYRRLRTRSEFAQSIEGRLPTRAPTDLIQPRLDTLVTGDDGSVTVALEPRSTRDGVYPVRVELREADGGHVIDAFTTFMVTLPAAVEADPLSVAVVLPIHAPPSTPGPRPQLDVDRASQIADVASSLTRAPGVEVSVLPTPETLEELANSTRPVDRDTAAALGQALTGRQVLGTTYVPVDVRALVDANLAGELNAQVARGRSVVERVLTAVPARNVRVLDERLDTGALAALENQDVQRLVVPEALLESIRPPNDITLTARFEIEGRRGRFDAAAGDVGLAAHFTRDLPPALAASHLLADLAVLWLDRPGKAPERRGAVAIAPRTWKPTAAFLDTLLEGLAANPILEPVTVNRFFETVGQVSARRGALTREFQAPPAGTGLNTSAIRGARRDLEAFASVVEPDNPTLDALDRLLLTSQSTDLRPSVRTSMARSVAAQVAGNFAAVAMPERRSITLTAREGELPITVTNRLPFPVRVVLTLESDALDFPDGATRQIELTRENTTERFQVHARGTGSFPVRVRVAAPAGGVVIAQSRFTVRSTAVSGVGIALSVGAALFLVVWWAGHLRSRRTARRAETTA